MRVDKQFSPVTIVLQSALELDILREILSTVVSEGSHRNKFSMCQPRFGSKEYSFAEQLFRIL
jgi:hypothetical protein